MSSQSSEFQEIMALQSLGKANVVKVIKAVNRITEGFVIFLLDQEVVVGVIHRLNVELRTTFSRGECQYMRDPRVEQQ